MRGFLGGGRKEAEENGVGLGDEEGGGDRDAKGEQRIETEVGAGDVENCGRYVMNLSFGAGVGPLGQIVDNAKRRGRRFA